MRTKNLGLLTALGLQATFAGAATPQKPNILYVMSDDHTSNAIGIYGSRLAVLNPTPTIDAIAREGMVMRNAFCQNAISTPSRASIMTGQCSAVNDCPTLGNSLPKDRQYLAIEMEKAGYQTAIIGKWHLGALPESFDYFKVLDGQGTYFDPVFYETGATEVITSNAHGRTKTLKNAVQMQGHSTDCIANSALDWFKTKRDKDKPFFFCLQFKAPHDMFEYAPRYESYLADVNIPEPENMRDRKNFGSLATRGDNDELIPYIGTSIGRRNPRRNYTKSGIWVKNLDKSKSNDEIMGDAYQGYMKAYLRCVKGVDDNLKRVIDYLKAEGLYENTIIIYTGDQGFYLGEHDFMDKRWPYEESMRMPFIVRYPKSVKVGFSDAIVENIDYAPTMLDFAGVNTPSYMQGKSFKSILETGKESKDSKQAAYYHYWMHMASHDNPACIAIRTKQYKLIQYYGAEIKSDQPQTPPGWELYDLKADPTEDNNLYDNPTYASVIVDLKKQLKLRRAELGEDNPKFKFNAVIDKFWNYGPAEKAEAIEISHRFKVESEKTKLSK